MPHLTRVLVVEDDRFDNNRYCQMLLKAGYQVESVTNVEQAQRVIAGQPFDVVLLDMLLPIEQIDGSKDFGGITLLRQIKQRDDATQVIAITGYGSRELAVDATRLGAYDYIVKDPDADARLPGSVRTAAARAQLMRTSLAASPEQESETTPATPNHLIANSQVMRQMLRRAQALADLSEPLLIVGEAGVGKELVASVIHHTSPRAGAPLVVVPCDSLNGSLARLWGDATTGQPSLCAQAEGGTLLLKRINDLHYNEQRQLVELVKRSTYTPIGGVPTVANIRIIATATADLALLVRQGRFWRPLYEALSVASLEVPPLRDRRDSDDITAIAGYILKHHGLAAGIAPDAIGLLIDYNYPHENIKELEQVLRDAADQSQGAVIERAHLAPLARIIGERRHEQPISGDGIPLGVEIIIPGNPATLYWDTHVGGRARSIVRLPFAQETIPLILRALDAAQWPTHPQGGPQFSGDEQATLARLGLWDHTRVAPDLAQKVGRMLHEAVVSDSVARGALYGARNAVVQQQQPLALTMHFPPDAVWLAALPWELLWDEQPILFSRTRRPSSLVRYIATEHATLAPRTISSRKLRMLAVCPQAGIPDHVHVGDTLSRDDAFQPLVDKGLIEIEQMRPASISQLRRRLDADEPIDLLHFYGHGVWRDGMACLQLDDGLLNASQLATMLYDIPLVVLYACRSGSVASDDLFTGIAPMLNVETGASVVAMQFTISIRAANCFAGVLYEHLAQGSSIQHAVARGRKALYVEHPESWYVPVVYIRASDQQPIVLVRPDAS